MREAVRDSVPPGTEELNLRAFDSGVEYYEQEYGRQRPRRVEQRSRSPKRRAGGMNDGRSYIPETGPRDRTEEPSCGPWSSAAASPESRPPWTSPTPAIPVTLVEKSPSLGGRMAQLDKTFPTMDCAI